MILSISGYSPCSVAVSVVLILKPSIVDISTASCRLLHALIGFSASETMAVGFLWMYIELLQPRSRKVKNPAKPTEDSRILSERRNGPFMIKGEYNSNSTRGTFRDTHTNKSYFNRET